MGAVCSCSKVIGRSASVVPEERIALSEHTASGDVKQLSTHKAHRRGSVSAEAAALASLKQKKSLIPKTEDTRAQLRDLIKSTILFHELEEEQEEGVLDALFERQVKAGETIIHEGDVGDNFYLIESGTFQASKDGEVKFTYDGKGAFGELALMYNCPRAATITAFTDGKLWGMDRSTFRAVIVSSMAERRDRYESTLQQMEIFRHLTQEQLAAIADCVTVEQYEAGHHIVRENEELATNTKFYMIESGTVECLRTFEGKKLLTKALGPGEVFGEVALLTKAPRQADCVAVTKVKCLAMSRDAFERLMGPVEKVLAQHIEDYNKLNAGVECHMVADAGPLPGSATSESVAATSTNSMVVLTDGLSQASVATSDATAQKESSQSELHGAQQAPASTASPKAAGHRSTPANRSISSGGSSRMASASASPFRPGSNLSRASPSGVPLSRRPPSGASASRASPSPSPSRAGVPPKGPRAGTAGGQEGRSPSREGEGRRLAPVRSFPLLDMQEGSRHQSASDDAGGQVSPSKLTSQIQEWERRLSGRDEAGASAVPTSSGGWGKSSSKERPAEEAATRGASEVDEAKRIAGRTVSRSCTDLTTRSGGATEGEAPALSLESIEEDTEEARSKRGTQQ